MVESFVGRDPTGEAGTRTDYPSVNIVMCPTPESTEKSKIGESGRRPPPNGTDCSGEGKSGEGDREDLVAEDAARHADLDDVADLLAQQALPDRAGGEDLVV